MRENLRRRVRRCAALAAAALTCTAVVALPAHAAPQAASAVPAGAPTPAASAAVPVAPIPPAPPTADRGQAAKDRLDRKADTAPAVVTTWGVDETTGRVVVEVVGDRSPAVDRFTADQDPSVVEVRTDAPPVRRFADVVGGDAITSAGGRCSVGFSARDSAGTPFVITAGHCTENTTTWRGANNTTLGPVARTAFPGDDFGSIRVTNTAGWTLTSQVRGAASVLGSTEAPIGARVCRSGSTTGFRCGTIQARNQTVNYGGGDVVSGLVRTSACAEPGDSGGSVISGRQAQGMTSGGSGDCRVGGTTFYQPLNEALSRYGLRLVTG